MDLAFWFAIPCVAVSALCVVYTVLMERRWQSAIRYWRDQATDSGKRLGEAAKKLQGYGSELRRVERILAAALGYPPGEREIVALATQAAGRIRANDQAR